MPGIALGQHNGRPFAQGWSDTVWPMIVCLWQRIPAPTLPERERMPARALNAPERSR